MKGKKMKTKKMIAFALALLLGLTFTPTASVVEAASVHTEFEEFAGLSITSGYCHCGALRGETVYFRYTGKVCPVTYTCTLTIEESRTYYYCTDPYCGDNYYSQWDGTGKETHSQVH
jgi:hypothetical protein